LLFFRITPEGETPMLTDAAGSEPVALVDTPLPVSNWVDWTSDSAALVFSVDPSLVPASQPSGLVMLPIDGSVKRIPVEAEVHQHAFPAPRPVGGDTVELLYRSSSDPEAAQLRVGELTSDGAVVRDGTVLSVNDIDGVRTGDYGNEYDFESSTWSPTGDRFAYHTLHDVAGAQDGNGMRVHVARYSADADPAGQADTLVEYDPMSDDEVSPVWSPDGSRVAFQAYDGREVRLVIMPVPVEGPVDASAAVVSEAFMTAELGARLRAGDGLRLSYAWAPDGASIVLVDGVVGRQGPAHLMNATTGQLVPLGWDIASWPSRQPSAG
jgi:dipeptidyl aminopeptidase/acylaminoacyl peptidase